MRALLAPRLRHRVDIQALDTVEDSETGAVVEVWDSILGSSSEETLPAEIVPVSGREFIAASQQQAGVTHRITIRWRDDVKPTMRVTHEGAFFNIRAVLPDPTLRRWLTLMCEQGVNDG